MHGEVRGSCCDRTRHLAAGETPQTMPSLNPNGARNGPLFRAEPLKNRLTQPVRIAPRRPVWAASTPLRFLCVCVCGEKAQSEHTVESQFDRPSDRNLTSILQLLSTRTTYMKGIYARYYYLN